MTDIAEHSDEKAILQTSRAAAMLREAIENVYEGDPVHELIQSALRHAEEAVRYMIRLRDNQ